MKLNLMVHLQPIPITLEVEEGTDIEDDWSRYEEEIIDEVIQKLEPLHINEIIDRDMQVQRNRGEQ